MRRLALLLLLLLGTGQAAWSAGLRLVRGINGELFGRALAVLDDDLLTSSREGAQLLDGMTGEHLRTYVVPSEFDVETDALALAGGKLLVGVSAADLFAGAVYVFDATTGAPAGAIRNPTTDRNDFGREDAFGSALLVVGALVYVGSPWGTAEGTVDAGAVHVFDTRTLRLVRTLSAPVRHANDRFGSSLTVVGDTIAVGAPEDDRAGENAGAVYLFNLDGVYLDAIRSPSPGTRIGGVGFAAHFGQALGVLKNELLVGTPFNDGGGAVHIFDPTRGAITRVFRSHCSFGGFGWTVATVGANVVIGDPFYAQFGSVSLFDGERAFRLAIVPNPTPKPRELFGSTFATHGALVYIGDPLDHGPSDTEGGVYIFATDDLCGDGKLDLGEVCDDGNQFSGDGCDPNCQPTGCGSGLVTPGEQCDDGNTQADDGCDPNCTIPGCGNGFVSPSEACDDGNRSSGDGCDTNCRPTGCGNGIRTAGEQCDDGNQTAGDGCEPDCTTTPGGRGPEVAACVASPALCDDRDACTVDTCESTGCAHAPIPGLDAVICILRGAAAQTPACTGQRVPRAINRRLAAVTQLLERGRDMSRSPAKKKVLRKAAHTLRRAGTLAAFAWREEKVTADCAAEMLRVIGAASGRFDTLRGRRPEGF